MQGLHDLQAVASLLNWSEKIHIDSFLILYIRDKPCHSPCYVVRLFEGIDMDTALESQDPNGPDRDVRVIVMCCIFCTYLCIYMQFYSCAHIQILRIITCHHTLPKQFRSKTWNGIRLTVSMCPWWRRLRIALSSRCWCNNDLFMKSNGSAQVSNLQLTWVRFAGACSRSLCWSSWCDKGGPALHSLKIQKLHVATRVERVSFQMTKQSLHNRTSSLCDLADFPIC